jgi:hypothetical protein
MVQAPVRMRALGPADAFRESWRLFRLRPGATLALGAALLTSLLAVCCMLGVVAAPWFLCELFAMQIALGSGQRPARTRAWLWAGFVQMVAVILLCAVVGLTLLSVGVDIAHSVLVWILAGSFTLSLTVYFEHAPAILLDRGGNLTTALLESARVVQASGAVRTWFTSGLAHALSLGPIVLGVVGGAAFGTLASSVLWGLLLLPLAALCLALGQGMVVASYLALRDVTADVARLPAQATLSTSRALLWSVLLLAVLSGPVAVSAALLAPAIPGPTERQPGGDVLLTLSATPGATTRFIPESAVELTVSTTRVQIDAGGGGGAGSIPLGAAAVREVRVRRVPRHDENVAHALLAGSVFALDIQLADGRSLTTRVDESGVRLDDSFEHRLSARLPSHAIAALLGCLVWTALWIGLSVPAQGRLRKRLGELWLSGERGPAWHELDRTLRHKAIGAALWLAPAALGSLAIGLWAALGGGNLAP